jgi:hypothetical protein
MQIDLTKLLKDVPAGAWVALSAGYERVIAFGFDVPSVLADAQKKGEGHPIVLRVPEANTALAL